MGGQFVGIAYDRAVKTALANKNGSALGRDGENRLEPECWPALSPSFAIQPDDKVFTIGSCFARNVENSLIANGVKVPAREEADALNDANGALLLNKYTPPSIFQEIDWALALDGRTELTESDVADFFYYLPDGRVIDMHLHAAKPETVSDAIARRSVIAKIFNHITSSQVAVITLGYVEAWLDTKTGLFINMAPNAQMRRGKNRFKFVKLDYVACLDYVERAFAALKNAGIEKILVTTSPVPLQRTFTNKDVIVANNYSKSVLRAVAGAVSDASEGVDYFPSYESVMLTKQPYVWYDDLVHVQPSFVNKIMARVIQNYIPGREHEFAIADFTSAYEVGFRDRARELYSNLGDEVLQADNFVFQTIAAEVAFSLRNHEAARLHALSASDNGRQQALYLMRSARVLRKIGDEEAADELESEAFALKDFGQTRAIVDFLMREQRPNDAYRLIVTSDMSMVNDFWISRWSEIVEKVAGRQEAADYLRSYVKDNPYAQGATWRAAQLYTRDERWDDLIDVIDMYQERESSAPIMKKKLHALQKLGHTDEAAALAKRVDELYPANYEQIAASS